MRLSYLIAQFSASEPNCSIFSRNDCKKIKVKISKEKNTTTETMLFHDVRSCFASSVVYVLSSLFDKMMIVKLPSPIRMKAGISYCQINFSLRKITESVMLIIMANMLVVERSTRSPKG